MIKIGYITGIGFLVLIAATFTFLPLSAVWFALFGNPNIVEKDMFTSAPYAVSVNFEVKCNRYFDREIGVLISPPVSVSSVSNASAAVSGRATVLIKQGDITINKVIDIAQTGQSIDEVGVWLKPIYRFSPLEGYMCNSQYISIEIHDLNIDLSQHKLSIYVSRDNRI